MKPRRRIVTGEYEEHGYTVFINGVPCYSAGNCVHDSAVMVAPGSPDAVPLRRMRAYCKRTAHEIAGERQGSVGGVSRQLKKAA